MSKMYNQIIEQLTTHQELKDLLKTFTEVSAETVYLIQRMDSQWLQENSYITAEPGEKILFDCLETMELHPADEVVPIISCDMSTVKIAETLTGSIWAVRGTIVFREHVKITAVTVGPLLYTVSPTTTPKILETLFELLGVENMIGYIDFSNAPKIISNLFEKVLQLFASTCLSGGILLLDGALTAGPADSPAPVVEKIVENAKKNGVGVAAFSKSTTLTLLGRNIIAYAGQCRPPYVIKLPIILNEGWKIKNGLVYVSHLSPTLFPFRVDVASRIGDEKLFKLLLSSENIVHGYPETLIIAHQLAKLRKLDILSMQASLENILKKRLHHFLSVRETLFHPIDG